MNTKQTASQLRLAADILETGHPWEANLFMGWQKFLNGNPLVSIANDNEIRLAFATPPDGRLLFNRHKLTADQVGAGWRLVTDGDKQEVGFQIWSESRNSWGETCTTQKGKFLPYFTYRVPISVPWPDSKPDPYAALKQAHKEGKVIEISNGLDERRIQWYSCPEPDWTCSPESYRIKPPFQLPPPPPGMSWHREDGWTAEMLPQGYRPLALKERYQKGVDEMLLGKTWIPLNHGGYEHDVADGQDVFIRTTRPLTFTHEGKTWTWHRPGDPMPCDGERNIYCVGGRLVSEHPRPAAQWFWNEKGEQEIIGWRYVDEPKTHVPLGPEDAPPGSVIQLRDRPDSDALAVGFHDVICVCRTHVIAFNEYGNKITIEWAPLKDWKINRSLPLTGKWNPDAWEPCHKPG